MLLTRLIQPLSQARVGIRRSLGSRFVGVAPLLLCAVPLVLSIGGCQTPGAGAAAQNARGVERFASGDYDSAISYFQESIDENPQSAETYYNLGSAYQRKAAATGDQTLLTQAENAYWTALESNPAPDTIVCCYRGLATSSASRGDVDGAMNILEEWSERNPTAVDPKLEIAYLLEAQGRNAEAYAKLQEVAKIAPNDYRPLYKMGSLAQQSGDLEDAVAQANAALKLNPDSDAVEKLARDVRTQYANSHREAKPNATASNQSESSEQNVASVNPGASFAQEVATTSAQSEGTEPQTQLVLPSDSGNESTSSSSDGNKNSGTKPVSGTPSIPLSSANDVNLGFGSVVASNDSTSNASVGAEFADMETPFGTATISKDRLVDDSDVKWIEVQTAPAEPVKEETSSSASSPIVQTSAVEPTSESNAASSSVWTTSNGRTVSTASGPVFHPVEQEGVGEPIATIAATETTAVPSAQTAPTTQQAPTEQQAAVPQVPVEPKPLTFQEKQKLEKAKVMETLSSFSNGIPSARSGAFF